MSLPRNIKVFCTEEGPRSLYRSTGSVMDIRGRGEMLLLSLGEALLNITCEISLQHKTVCRKTFDMKKHCVNEPIQWLHMFRFKLVLHLDIIFCSFS